MFTKRIIPCLDIKDGRTVKGTHFVELRDAGDPVELAARYAEEGADELVFLDITATVEKRKTLSELVYQVAHHVNIPFTVGGGISSVEDVQVLLQSGADKISVNSAAVKRPNLIKELASEFGSQCVVLAIDTKQEEDGLWYVYLNGGRTKTDILCVDWAKQRFGATQSLDSTGFAIAPEIQPRRMSGESSPKLSARHTAFMTSVPEIETPQTSREGLPSSPSSFRRMIGMAGS
ncbi:MAG: imidazole glycerol phosphate synthase cyclase subunit, partial [Sediminibacterium sp.]|nr:imidazole glycerol phosphate synthase cyclase subunit [Sediminibacterium sp.]